MGKVKAKDWRASRGVESPRADKKPRLSYTNGQTKAPDVARKHGRSASVGSPGKGGWRRARHA